MTAIKPLAAAEHAEKALIGCLFDDAPKFFPRFAAAGITEDSFWKYRRIYLALHEQFVRYGGQKIDFVSFVQNMTTDGKTDVIDALGGASEITDIATHAAFMGTAGWTQWAQQVNEAHACRIASTLSTKLDEIDTSEDAKDVLAEALEAITKATKGPSVSNDAKASVQSFLDSWVGIYEHGDLPGEPTGYDRIDRISGGMLPGQLIVFGGRESTGKSVLLYEIAARFISRGKVVSIHTLEMMSSEVVGRMLAANWHISYNSLTKPREATKADLGRIKAAARELASGKYWIDDSGGQTIEQIISEASRIRDEAGGLDLIVVDYLQLIEANRKRNETRENEVARASAALKQLAKKMRCPVITATQLNAEGESRESKAIQQDADWLLYIASNGIKVVKMRNAKKGDTLPLGLRGEYQQFVEMEFAEEPTEKKNGRYR